MSVKKGTVVAEDAAIDQSASGDGFDQHGGTADDRADMLRLGKVQELRRNFSFISMFGFSMLLMATWEVILSVIASGLVEGGTAGIIWLFFLVWVAFIFINFSMAEMGSMAPTVGGQYHWVSEFAPRKYQKPISYTMGWLCVLGWQTGAASGAFFAGTQIEGLIVLNYADYIPQGWHSTLFMIAMGFLALLFNTLLAKQLPRVENVMLVIHTGAFIGIVATLWALAPRSDDVHAVFTHFGNHGWSSAGTSFFVGTSAAIVPLLGADAAVHMSEELRDAGRTLPRCMIWSTLINGSMGWVMIVTVCVCLGNVEDALSSPTGYPYMEIFYNATQSKGATTAMCSFLIFMSWASCLGCMATASRQLWAFARDGAVPFGPWLCKVVWEIPLHTIIVTFAFVCIMSLVNLGSAAALNDVNSLGSGALLSSYLCSIGCITWRRISKSPLPDSKFRLGKFGLPMNMISLSFLLLFFVFAFFPSAPNPNAQSMNWAILIFGVVVVFSMVYYLLRARYRYVGPVEYVRKTE